MKLIRYKVQFFVSEFVISGVDCMLCLFIIFNSVFCHVDHG